MIIRLNTRIDADNCSRWNQIWMQKRTLNVCNNDSGANSTHSTLCVSETRKFTNWSGAWMGTNLHSIDSLLTEGSQKKKTSAFCSSQVLMPLFPYSSERTNIGKIGRDYRRKPQKLQNTCPLHTLSVASTRKMVASTIFPANITLRVLCFSFLGSPKNQNLHAITASYTILHVFLFATIIYRT